MVTALNTWYLYLVSAFRREEGQGFTEYALILALIVLVGIGAMATIGTDISALWDKIIAKFP